MTDGGPGLAGPGALVCKRCCGRVRRDGLCMSCLADEFTRAAVNGRNPR